MALRRPFLSVIGPSGGNLVSRLGSLLVGVEITDQGGYESDECTISVRRERPYWTPPAKGTVYVVSIGWSETGAVKTGTYTLERLRMSGDPGQGEQIELVCRAADFIDKLKQSDSEHFDKDNGHKTYGDVFRTLAGRAGVPAVISGDISDLPLPNGYLLRWQQSAIDLMTDMGDDIGAVVKPQAGKLVVRPRGTGTAAGGADLPPIVIAYNQDYSYEVEIEPRPGYREVAVRWFDSGDVAGPGRPAEETKTTDYQYSRLALPHPFASKDAAARGAAAAGQEFNRSQGSATFETPGDPTAVAEAPVIPLGFGPGVDDVEWMASTVTHSVTAEEGFKTTVEAQTKEKAG